MSMLLTVSCDVHDKKRDGFYENVLYIKDNNLYLWMDKGVKIDHLEEGSYIWDIYETANGSRIFYSIVDIETKQTTLKYYNIPSSGKHSGVVADNIRYFKVCEKGDLVYYEMEDSDVYFTYLKENVKVSSEAYLQCMSNDGKYIIFNLS